MDKQTVLILDDDKKICDVLSLGLANQFDVTTTDDADIAYRIALKNPPDALLLDIYVNGGNGIDLCQRLRQN